MMNRNFISMRRIAARTKTCSASALVSILICSGTGYADCNPNLTYWDVIQDVAERSVRLIDAFVTVNDKEGIKAGFTGNLDQALDALIGKNNGADKDDIHWLQEQIAIGFLDDRWINAETKIGEFQTSMKRITDKISDKKATADNMPDLKPLEKALFIAPTDDEARNALSIAQGLFSATLVWYMPLVPQSLIPAERHNLNYTLHGNPATDLVQNGPNSFYDWRLGIPAALQLVSDAVLVAAAAHPGALIDSNYPTELKDLRQAFMTQYENMLKGIRCQRPVSPRLGHYTRHVCADMATGLSAQVPSPSSHQTCLVYDTKSSFGSGATVGSETLCGISPVTEQEAWTDLRREVIRHMPLYEVKATIDKLFLLGNPQPDLTDVRQRIPSFANRDVCLEATNEGTDGAGLQLLSCSGDALQHWVYDRSSGLIGNPDIGKCIENSYGVHASGQSFPVSISDCFGDDWQKWTYDPDTHALLSALGPVLTIKSESFADSPSLPSTVKLGDSVFAGQPLPAVSDQQKWLADPIPPAVCERSTKQNTALFGNSDLPHC